MDKLPKTTFIKSPQTETERLIQASIQIANGFYKAKGFVVLPCLHHNPSAEVVFPKLDYQSIPNYWHSLTSLKSRFPTQAPRSFYRQIETLIIQKNLFSQAQNHKALIEKWQSSQEKFWKLLESFLPGRLKNIRIIQVRLTDFGSISSWWLDLPSRHLICYLRFDAVPANLAEAIISVLIRSDQHNRFLWEQSESIVDFLLTRSSLAPLFKNYRPTTSGLIKITPAVRKKSNLYLNSLGVVYRQNLFLLHNRQIFLKGRKINHHLTKNQTKILSFLIKNQDQLVNYDDLADVLWGQENFKSLWALNKAVQRLKYRLISLGLPAQKLKVFRGQGYVLTA